MKKLKLLLPLLALASFAFISCSDDDDDATTALQRLQNKWSVDSLVFKTTTGGTVSTTTKYTGSTDDYYDFRTDNKLYYDVHSTPPLKDTVSYQLIGNSTLVTDGSDTSSISVLTSSKLLTYTKTGNATDYLEVFGYFRR